MTCTTNCIPLRVVCGIYIEDAYSHYITSKKEAFAIFVDGSSTIEGSDDNFTTTVYSKTFTENAIEEIAVNHNYWRVTGGAKFVIGTIHNIDRPTYPYYFDKAVKSTDRETLGGRFYSKINSVRRVSKMNWKLVHKDRVDNWRSWFDNSNSFRNPFAILDLMNDDVVLCTSTNDFPLQLDVSNLYGGSMELTEYL